MRIDPTRRVVFTLLLVAAVVCGFWVERATDTSLIPPGPQVEDAGYGPGSDWDCQWHYAAVAAGSLQRGAAPDWDPYLDYGVPHLGNPENFGQHPAFLLGSRGGDLRYGILVLVGFALILLAAGSAWLTHVLGGRWILGVGAALLVPLSPEWAGRLSQGHLMFLGIAAWPALAAGVLSGLRLVEEGRRTDAVTAGALGGLAVGLAAWGGGHYPVVFSSLIVLLLVVGWAVQRRGAWLALALFPPLLFVDAPGWVRLIYVACLFAGVTYLARERLQTVWRSAPVVVGVALGALATGAAKLLPATMAAATAGLFERGSWGPPDTEFGPWQTLVVPSDTPVETPLLLGYAGWACVVVVVVFLYRSEQVGRWALATTGIAMFLIGLASGSDLQPWELIGWLPGFGRVNFPQRLQWIVLLVGPVGGAVGLSVLIDRLPRLGPHGVGREGIAAVLLVAMVPSVLAALPDRVEQDGSGVEQDGGRTARFDDAARSAVSGIAKEGGLLSRSSLDGQIRPRALCGLGLDTLSDNPPALVWASGGEAVSVAASQAGWTLSGHSGATVTFAQRGWSGWSCEGAELLDVEADKWVSVRMGPSGSATCTWSSPGGASGWTLQILALLTLLFLGKRYTRGRSARAAH